MASFDGCHHPRLGALISRLRIALAALVVASLLPAAPALARRKKKTPEPAPTTAPEPTPAQPEPAPAPKPAEKEPAAEPVTGPTLSVVGLALDAPGEAEAPLDALLAEQAVRRARKQQLVPLEDALDPAAAALREKNADEGRKALEAAKRALLQDLDADTAGALADKAYNLFLKSDLTRHFDALVDAAQVKIAALAALGPKSADRVRTGLTLLLPMIPRAELSRDLLNPDVIKLADNLRADLQQRSALALQVQTGTVHARIFLDGDFRGISPVTIDHLPPGQHLLTVVAPGYNRVQQSVNPGPEPTVTIPLQPSELSAQAAAKLTALKQSFRSNALPKAAAELAALLKVEQLLIVAAQAGATPGARQVDAVRVSGTPLKPNLLADLDAPASTEPAKRATAVDALATQSVGGEHLLRGHRVVLEASGGGGNGMKYAGYGLIGGGVVAAGLGTVFGLSAKSNESTFKTTPQTQGAPIASSGKTDAVLANVAFGAAVVAVGAGVALVVMNHGSTATSDEGEAATPPPPRRTEPARPAEKRPEPKPVEKKPEPKPVEKKPEPKPAETPKPVEKKPEPKPVETPKPVEKKPEPTEPPKPKPTEPVEAPKPTETPKPKPTEVPDAGAVDAKKPPRDLGEDIRE